MPSKEAVFMNEIFAQMAAHPPAQPLTAEEERKQGEQHIPQTVPDGVTITTGELDGLYAEWIEKPNNQKGIIFYIHGGGFSTGSATQRRDICQYLTDISGWNCVTFNYRLAPENKWPAHLEDCVTAYLALLKTGVQPENVVFMGESAGGQLVLSLALRLKELGHPQPRAIVALSPCVTHAESLPSHFANISTDFMLRDAVARKTASIMFAEGTTIDELRSSTTSPLYGNYSGLPPIFLATSDTEVLYDDALLLYGRLLGAGHLVKLDIQHGVCHAWPIFTFIPEAQDTLKSALAFVE